MSIPDPSSTPPPVPRRGLSPWAWVGIGCGGLTLLGFGGCAVLVWNVTSQVRTEMAKPFVESEAIASIGDIPLYPDAKIDAMGTKAARGGLIALRRMIPADRQGVLALRTVDPDEKIVNWYQAELQKLGYKKRDMQERSGRNNQVAWVRDKAMAMVQIQHDRKKDEIEKLIILMRFEGLKER
ncbi:MAG: hypothetical protein ACOVT5_05450 [Armatimonadaceae bacterium]